MIRIGSVWCAALLLVSSAGSGWAQSLLAREGLGYVVEPLDARARGLGGAALGLPGVNLSLVNPAVSARVPAPALLVGFQYDQSAADFAGGSAEGQTPRFPVIQAALPLGQRWGVSVGYGGFLNQSWAVETQDTVIGLRAHPVVEQDRLASTGGVGRLRLGVGRTLGERFSVGLGVDLYTGSVQDSVSRVFYRSRNPDTLESTLVPFRSVAVRSFSGVGFVAGARWNASEALGLEATVSHGGSLEADSDVGGEQLYDLPLSFGLGAHGRVAQRTVLVATGRWTGWDRTAGDLGTDGARNVWSLAGGVEHELAGANERAYPLRLGGRYQKLPFAGAQSDFADERAVSAGLGARLGNGAAWLDLAVERGNRSVGALDFSENFWRISTSLMVFGR